MEQRLVIFDVCNTLYDSNTTFDFILYTLRRKLRHRLLLFYLLSHRYSPLFIVGFFWSKLTHHDWIRTVSVKLLKGLSEATLLHMAEGFYNDYLAQREIKEVMALLQKERTDAEVWLFSSSMEPVIKVIANKLSLQYESTTLQYKNGIFTGLIHRDLTGAKDQIFMNRFGKSRCIHLMCSDNKSDYNLLQQALSAIVVVYKRSDKQFWQNINAVFIEKY